MEETLTFSSSGNTATISSDAYYPTTTDNTVWNGDWVGNWKLVQPPEVHFSIYQEPKREEVKDMRGLFRVFVVNPEKGEVIYQDLTVAKDKETAKYKVLRLAAKTIPLADGYDLDDLDIICNRLGDVRKKKEIQEVRMVNDD